MIVSYGVIYYAFPVLAAQIAAAHRLVPDRGHGGVLGREPGRGAAPASRRAGCCTGTGPRPVMTAASVLGAVSVAAIAAAPSYGWFLAAWLAAGIAGAGLFYPPAFAALTAWYGPRRVQALTTLTLAAGFASTIFAPLASALAAHLGWRGIYLTLAAVLAAVTIPAHALLPCGRAWATGRARATAAGGSPCRDRHVLASQTFLQLVTAATLCAFAQYAALVNLVPLLEGRGLPASLAAWGLGLGGAGQVAGRLCYRYLASSRLGTRGRMAAIIAAGGAATLLLGLLPGPAALLVAVSVIAGAVRGVFTLTEATIVADYWGADRYAVLNGVFNAPLIAAGAVAPAAGAGIAVAAGSYPALFAILAATAAVGAALAATAPAPARVKAAETSGSVRETGGEQPDPAAELG